MAAVKGISIRSEFKKFGDVFDASRKIGLDSFFIDMLPGCFSTLQRSGPLIFISAVPSPDA
jgi:hypothetical protein